MLAKKILEKKSQKGACEVYTVNENMTAFDAVVICDEKKIGSLMVVNDSKEVTGIITEKDVLYKCYNTTTSLKDKKVKELMTPIDKIIIGKENDHSEYFRNVMTNKRIRHIPIFSSDNNLIGIISSGDILKAELENNKTEIKLLKEHIQNPYGIHVYSEE